MILLQVILLALNAVFACAEIAVLSVNETKISRMAEEGDRRAARLVRLVGQPSRFLSTIQVAITLSGFLGSAFAADNFSDPLVDFVLSLGVPIPRAVLNSVSVVLITVILSYFTLVFGELVPKRIAMRKTEAVALGISGLIDFISKVCKPVVWLLTASVNGVLRLIGIDPNAEEEAVGEEDIRLMVDASSERGSIDHEEKEFIQNVFEFDDLTAGEIATHRTEVDFLWLEETMDEWDRIIHDSRHTLYPVCDDSPDNIIGILNAKDYFRLDEKDRQTVMREAVSPAYFVPETVKADVLFRNMKRTRNKMAIVLDEYGGMSGLVTINDLVEQLVGDLEDDDPGEDDDVESIELIGDNVWRVHGNVELDDLEEATGLEIEDLEYDTITGLVFDRLGQVPQDGSQLSLETAGLHIDVIKIEDHQVKQAVVRLLPPEPKPEEETEKDRDRDKKEKT